VSLLALRKETKCREGRNCRDKKCRLAHQDPAIFGEAGPNSQARRFQNDTHAGPACNKIAVAQSSIVVETIEGQNFTNTQNKTVISLLQNFQDMFGVQTSWIDELAASLAEPSCNLILIFVDLDNVPYAQWQQPS
jgi:hypothetical protein